ncbi:hypothetical protein [Xenorhabdus bovienii]|uniref:hypothetical protein n=1 Tax=Xenorhabdus bovienii TaxID=40576 RepID=UPI001EE08465|nr:hypothetical protein [Xenorhabdus bovienii]MCG3463167.1 hypothetical protein [Xenorhabdus bovienii]
MGAYRGAGGVFRITDHQQQKNALKMGVKLSINLYPFELLDAMVINNHTVWSVFYG